MKPLKLLFIGDVVGAPGRKMVVRLLPKLIKEWELGLVVCNAENAAGGSGLTIKCYDELVEAGVDVFTMGDHVYRKDEIFTLFGQTDRLCRPINFPPDAPGEEVAFLETREGAPAAVFTVMGRTFMKPIDCPFRAADRVLAGVRADVKVIFVDVHAEATSDKQLLGRYLDGRVSAVLGTHTHVATADEQILPKGTAYQTDVGMTGPYESIIGRRIDRVMNAAVSFLPSFFEVATGNPRLSGSLVEIDVETGRAIAIRRVWLGGEDESTLFTI